MSIRSRFVEAVALWLPLCACRREPPPALPAELAALRSFDTRDDDLAERRDDGVYARGVRWIGRADLRDPRISRFAWSGAGFSARFVGTGLTVALENDVAGMLFALRVDDHLLPPLVTGRETRLYTLVEALPPGEHTVSLLRTNEGQMGESALHAFHVIDGHLLAPPPAPARLVEVVGDSVSAGYGNLGYSPACHFSFETESVWHTFGALAAAELGAELSVIAMSGHGLYRDLDGSRELVMPRAYERALPWQAHPVWRAAKHPDVVVVALGANDLGADVDDPRAPFAEAYAEFLGALRELHPKALIVCVAGPALSNEGRDLARLRDVVSRALARRASAGDTRLRALALPLLEDVALGCDYHPNAAAHAGMARELTALLRAELGW